MPTKGRTLLYTLDAIIVRQVGDTILNHATGDSIRASADDGGLPRKNYGLSCAESVYLWCEFTVSCVAAH